MGGLGIMMISTAFIIFSKRRITLRQRQLIMTDMNQPRLSGIVRLIRITFVILLWFQLLFGALFSVYFYIRGYFDHWHEAVFHGFYQAISAVTNSGFDITGESIKPFEHDYPFFIYDHVPDFHWWNRFSGIDGVSRMALVSKNESQDSFSVLFVYQTSRPRFCHFICQRDCLDFLLEKIAFKDLHPSVQWINSMFYSMTTRNAGLQIHDLGDFQITTLIVFSLLMFIGCSPSSVGGGIRTTTVAIIGLYLYSF